MEARVKGPPFWVAWYCCVVVEEAIVVGVVDDEAGEDGRMGGRDDRKGGCFTVL